MAPESFPPATPPATASSLSAVLDALTRGDGERLSMQQALTALEDRSFGGVILLLTLVALCLPPGLSAVPGAPLFLVGLQMLLGREHPWLPRFIRRRSFDRARAARVAAKARPIVARVERVLRPRLGSLIRPGHSRLVGLACVGLSVFMIVPLPLLHGTAGMGLLAFAAGLLARDGLALLAGWALTVGCGGVLAVMVAAARLGARHFL
ncbi:exopolysaccharide biosynthesis protein [Phenylobacterium sp.]|jgi:hypothetical protein|uniref:exopolysaccharide biosynthesis protein n=1 Tax=Phenylobacterium sp. TaxID=1871053 RepID=UPI002F4001A6